MTTKHKYLSNKELLKEIHKSKNTYCEFADPEYQQYDIIVDKLKDIFKPSVQKKARENRAARLSQELYRGSIDEYDGPITGKPKLADFKIDPKSFKDSEIVYRVMTFEHIPEEPTRKKNPKKESEFYAKLNFKPFKHYIIKRKKAVEVGRSHTKNGEFSLTHGGMTDKLARMFILLVERYSQRANWRGYTYVDEMKGQSLLQLSQMGLQFDEAKSDNPFAYYTAAITNSFTRVLNTEKNSQKVRDEILIDMGQTPSFARQIQHEEDVRRMREEAAQHTDENE
jgi:hypothetical protein